MSAHRDTHLFGGLGLMVRAHLAFGRDTAATVQSRASNQSERYQSRSRCGPV